MKTRFHLRPGEVPPPEEAISGWDCLDSPGDCSLKQLRTNLSYYESHFILTHQQKIAIKHPSLKSSLSQK